jgi:amino acid transporter
MFKLFVVLILVHLIADFFIKTDWFINEEKKLRRFLIYGIIYFLVSMIAVLSVGMLKQSIVAPL